MSDIGDIFDKEYYDKEYFAVPEGKKFLGSDGEIHGWSYANPTGEFLGAKEIVKAWREVFNPEHLLDVGAGRGTFIAYARDLGIDAYGFDYSKWATSEEGRYSRCEEGWLIQHDARDEWPYFENQFNLVTALDFYEHIYAEDLPKVIPEMYRVADKYVFLQIATVDGVREEGYILEKGEEVPKEYQGYAVAGHVTVQPESFWIEQFEHEDWFRNRGFEEWFVSLVDNRIIANWLQNSIIILERL
jgi:ubiquinone/menaquinone biosynthesis C-methylase UbiE